MLSTKWLPFHPGADELIVMFPDGFLRHKPHFSISWVNNYYAAWHFTALCKVNLSSFCLCLAKQMLYTLLFTMIKTGVEFTLVFVCILWKH